MHRDIYVDFQNLFEFVFSLPDALEFKVMIKLLALDLDGTLLNSRGEISAANLQAIRLAEEKGVLVTIATGRRFRDARPVALKAELNEAILTHNGALIKFAQTLEVVDFQLLEPSVSTQIIKIGQNFGADPMLSADPVGKGILYYENISETNIPLKKYLSWSRHLHGEEATESVTQVTSLEDILSETQTVHISFSGPCFQMKNLQNILLRELNGAVNVLATVYNELDFTLLDILPPNASKGLGLERLAAIEGLKPENVMVIGDNFNDLEMLEFAGTSIVMGNATPELLEDERFVTTLSNDESGVAYAIEKFILK